MGKYQNTYTVRGPKVRSFSRMAPWVYIPCIHCVAVVHFYLLRTSSVFSRVNS